MLPWRLQLRERRFLLWVALAATLGLLLCFRPLFDLLGYEFCFALSLLAAPAAAHLGARVAATARGSDHGLLLGTESAPRALAHLLWRAVALGWLLLVLPLVAITFNALRVPNCNALEGTAFFFTLPLCSTALAAVAGALWGIALPRAVLGSAAAVLTVLGSWAWGVYRFYSAPPIFAYDPFGGYFPGTLYDEAVKVGSPLLAARLYHLAWTGCFVLAAAHLFDPARVRLRLSQLRLHRWLTPALALCAVAAGGLTALRAPLGISIDDDYIIEQLGGVRHTTHFEIVYPETLERDDVERLAEDHEFRYAQLRALFGGAPRRIRSYVFEDDEQRRRLMGAARTNVAKPWLHQIYLEVEGFPHRVLKHELAHVFAGMHGDPLFGVSLRWRFAGPLPYPHFNVGLIEGLAVAADWRPVGELTRHQMAAAMDRVGLAPPVEQLFGLGFLAHASGRAYLEAGSLCRYLSDRYGFAKLTEAYERAGQFEAVYGRPLALLVADWKRFLQRVELSASQLQLVRDRLRRPSIFRRVCAHEVANLRRDARHAQYREAYRRAARLWRRICEHDCTDPGQLLALMTLTNAAEGPHAALQLRHRLLTHPALGKPLRRRALETIGDLYWLMHDRARAAAHYRRAAKLAANAAGRRSLALKLRAVTGDDPQSRRLLDYLVGWPGRLRDPAADVSHAYRIAIHSERGAVGPYLLGRQLAARDLCGDALGPLRRALAGQLPDSDFSVSARRTLGYCLYHEGLLSEARTQFRKLALDRAVPAGVRLAARDWLARIRWRLTGSAAQPR